MEVFIHPNAVVCRWHNTKITVIEKERGVDVDMSAIVSEEHKGFDNIMRGNYKKTAFGLTDEAAYALYYALNKVLSKKWDVKKEV